jgi:hypothetical protein
MSESNQVKIARKILLYTTDTNCNRIILVVSKMKRADSQSRRLSHFMNIMQITRSIQINISSLIGKNTFP